MSKPVAWLLSAYHADSHASWGDWLCGEIDGFDWQLFTLPGRHFRWRIRGNPLSWMDSLPPQPPALIVATSMVDLATLKGLRGDLAAVPALYYFHENQFAYPRSAGQHPSVDPQMVQLYGALSARHIAFNSQFNQDSFLQGIQQLLAKMPDGQPPSLTERLEVKASVLPVPIVPSPSLARDRRLILWNHRWEYDKAPEVFAKAIEILVHRGCEFRLALLGARQASGHPALQRLRELAGQHILADGFLDRSRYQQQLGQAGIVVSTAIHEFQGLGVLEAVAAGATPVVPDDLCYPEQYPADCRYPAGDASALADHLQARLQAAQTLGVDVSSWHGESLLPAWRNTLDSLLD